MPYRRLKGTAKAQMDLSPHNFFGPWRIGSGILLTDTPIRPLTQRICNMAFLSFPRLRPRLTQVLGVDKKKD